MSYKPNTWVLPTQILLDCVCMEEFDFERGIKIEGFEVTPIFVDIQMYENFNFSFK